MKKREKFFLFSRKLGQVWLETVIYTLIAFVMIGLVLSYARPKIQELQDNAILQQSTDMMKQIDSTILNMGGAGNQRVLEIGIKQGELIIDGINDKLVFQMESQNLYSEPGKNISDGNVIVSTQKMSGYNLVSLTLDYKNAYDVQYDGTNTQKTISKASNPYKLSISNGGAGASGKTVLNISVS